MVKIKCIFSHPISRILLGVRGSVNRCYGFLKLGSVNPRLSTAVIDNALLDTAPLTLPGSGTQQKFLIFVYVSSTYNNPLNTELNPICQ